MEECLDLTEISIKSWLVAAEKKLICIWDSFYIDMVDNLKEILSKSNKLTQKIFLMIKF
jgi:hypothetical protein